MRVLEEEMVGLCTLAEAILEEGMAKGGEDRGIHDIKCVMRNVKCTVERAMDILECDAGDRERLAREVMASGE